MKAAEFLHLLESQGFDFFSGVPCSYIGPLCRELSTRPQSFHVPAVREDIAVGIAAGAYLAGKQPVIYMQNAGLGYSIEAFASLLLIYKIPCLVLVTYRGPEDPDMEEHLVMGEHTRELIAEFGMKYSILEEDKAPQDILDIKNHLSSDQIPYCLLIPKGAIE